MAEEKAMDYTTIIELIRHSKSVDEIVDMMEKATCKFKNADKFHRFIIRLCLAEISCADKVKLVERIRRKTDFDESLTLVYYTIMCDVLHKFVYDADLYLFVVFMISTYQALYIKDSIEFENICYMLSYVKWPIVDTVMLAELFATKTSGDTLFGYFTLCRESSSPQVFELINRVLKSSKYRCTNDQHQLARMKSYFGTSRFQMDQKQHLLDALDANAALPPAPVAPVDAEPVPFADFLSRLQESRDVPAILANHHAANAAEFKQFTFIAASMNIPSSTKLEYARILMRNTILKGNKHAHAMSVWGLLNFLSDRSEQIVDFIEDVIERSFTPCLYDEQFDRVMTSLAFLPEATKTRLARALMENVRCNDVIGVCRLIDANSTEEGAALVKDVLKMQRAAVTSEGFIEACSCLSTAQFSDESKFAILNLVALHHEATPRTVRALFMLAPGSSLQKLADFILATVKKCSITCFTEHQKSTALGYLARSLFSQQQNALIESAINENMLLGSTDINHAELCALLKKFASGDDSPRKFRQCIENCSECCIETADQFLFLLDLLLSSDWYASEILATVRVLLRHVVYYTDSEVARQVLDVCDAFTSDFVNVVVGHIKQLNIKCIQTPAQFGRFIVKMRSAEIGDGDLAKLVTAVLENVNSIN